MGTDRPAIDKIFCAATEINGPEDRKAFVQRAAGGDQDLIAQVHRLLDAHCDVGSFLDQAAPELDATTDQVPVVERPGQTIGHYKLREQLGAGGFEVVWAAEQTRPVRRKVALKIIKPGMDSRDVVARFEAERQALAMMDHANIARVFDAGTTPQGRPYFVMELIRGIPITEYCDENKLTVHQRLALFVQVCRAVQHAHQKGIIHRDIKPSNILVTLHDGVPVPKVIDFGIAKALNQRLTDKTIYTRVHQAIGTLAYMSPEAAELSGLDMDTRADVYGLGVLLYELLTGATPFDRQRLEEAALHEACRIIREEEPPKASTRLSTLGAAATRVSNQRQTAPRDLAQLFRGDIDWILVKAMEKDRTRRYESAGAFAADVTRYLNDEPIEARPPSTTYRLRKLAARHRAVLAATIVVVFALIIGIVSSTLLAVQWKRSKEEAERASVQMKRALVGQQSALAKAQAANQKAREMLMELRDALLERGFLLAFAGDLRGVERVIENGRLAGLGDEWDLTLKGAAYLFQSDVKTAIEVLKNAAKDRSNVAALALLGVAYIQGLEYTKYEELYPAIQEAQPRAEYKDLDQFLLGYVRGDREFAKTADRMESILQSRPSWILLWSLVSDSRLVAAQQSGDRQQLEAALQQTESLQSLFPANKFVARCRFAALLSDLEYDRRHELSDLSDLQAQASEAAESLADYKLADRLRPHFFDLVGETEKARRAWIDTSKHSSPLIAFDAVGYLYRCGFNEDAWEIVRNYPGDTAEIKIAQAYMLVDSPEQREQAISLAKSAVDTCPTWWTRQMASKVFLLLGETDQARKVCLKWSEEYEAEPDAECPWIWLDRLSIEYLAGKIGGDKYKQADTTMWGEFFSHYTIGVLAISEGKWGEARNSLQVCEKTSSFISPEANWAKVFLKRLKTDPEWPRGHRLRRHSKEAR